MGRERTLQRDGEYLCRETSAENVDQRHKGLCHSNCKKSAVTRQVFFAGALAVALGSAGAAAQSGRSLAPRLRSDANYCDGHGLRAGLEEQSASAAGAATASPSFVLSRRWRRRDHQ